MMWKWKKYVAVLGLTLAMTLPMAGAATVPIGTVVDHVLYTDIRAYLDDIPIRSYNVSGYTVVAAEDLLDYGFDVVWNGTTRTLDISLNTTGKAVTGNYHNSIEDYRPIGAIAGDVLSTDIVTRVTDFGGRTYEIPSWNIGSQTVVSMDDLAAAFSSYYLYNDRLRVVDMSSLHYTDWSRDLSAPEKTDRLVNGFELKATGFSTDSESVQVEGNECWGCVEDLTITATNLSFFVSNEVLKNSDGCLDGLSTEVATFDSLRDNDPSLRMACTEEQRDWLTLNVSVFVTYPYPKGGILLTDELWLHHEEDGIRYTITFREPVHLADVQEIEIRVGDPAWCRERFLLEWYSDSRNSCEIIDMGKAKAYLCKTGPNYPRPDTYELYVVWPDGAQKGCRSMICDQKKNQGVLDAYTIEHVMLSEDGNSFTFECQVYSDERIDDYRCQYLGIGTYRMDLVTRELTLESIAPE